MHNRIIGIDVARAFAVIGMIIVNFKMVFGYEGNETIMSILGHLDGKAAATFVVLAGIGISLLSNSAVLEENENKIKSIKTKITKRAFLLFIIGISYIFIWPADILHFYGIYMFITLLFIRKSKTTLFMIALTVILLYPLLMSIWDYETGWNFHSIEYLDFWSLNGFIRNLFYNGFHPVFPWCAFMIIGLWFGRFDLNDNKFRITSKFFSTSIFIFTKLFSIGLIAFLSEGIIENSNELNQVLGTSPMPPLPIYMVSGISAAIMMISFCILISKKFGQYKIISILEQTGKLALTFYVAHVVFGMGLVETFSEKEFGSYSIEFSLGYAIFFSICCIVFTEIWKRYHLYGPIEFLMKIIAK